MPKGIYNRKKEEVKTEEKVEYWADPGQSIPEVQIVPRGTSCKGNEVKCGHEEKDHYGGFKGHCNTKDCICDGFYK